METVIPKLGQNMFSRSLKNQLRQKLFQGKAIIVTGARQTGKTTLSMELVNSFKGKTKIFNCDNPTDREMLHDKDLEFLIQLVGEAEIIFIDEGQKVQNIGQTVKLLVDHYRDKKQIVVTGTQESLTGRKYVYHLFPLSLEEIYPNKELLTVIKELEAFLIYGNYPEVVNKKGFEEKKEILKELTSSYLYKDIFEFQQVKNSNVLTNLLKALAFQIGSEVSYAELARLIGIDKKTVERYVDLLEKNYIIFRLSPYTRNKRKEISKLKKIYFCDVGIRNTIINNFNFLVDRNDVGNLWENFVISERLKYQAYHNIYTNNYFWRTYDGAEVDLVEERDGKLYGYEFKWSKENKKIRQPAGWQEYDRASYQVVSPKDLIGFVL